MLKFRSMYADTDHSVHRDYIEKAMDTSIAPNANGLYKLDRARLDHPRRPVAAPHEPRRAAATRQRAPR